VIAGIIVGVAVAVSALMKYLSENSLQVETTQRTKIQSDAFQTFTAARLQCYSTCTASGQTIDQCVNTCAKLVDKPDFQIPCVGSQCVTSWGLLQWAGLTVVLGLVGFVGYRVYEYKKHGKPLFDFPSLEMLPSSIT
jgi:hypothetical protein